MLLFAISLSTMSAPTNGKKPAPQLDVLQEEALRHTRLSLEHMERLGIQPEGKVALFLPP
ncbi:MAG: hypothetical protein IIC18_09720, partial [Bacteroidetes bacterium]|nr:hypothetical protein [Bacteroidota bacterium]